METGFLNFHDEEHFSICEQSSRFENGSSLFGGNDYVDSFSIPWEQKFNVNVSKIKEEPNCNEDYEKTFNAWNQHLKELDNSIKCEGDIFFPGIDDPSCFNGGSPSHEEEPVFPQSPFLKTGGCEEVVFSCGGEEDRGSQVGAIAKVTCVKAKQDNERKPVLEAGNLKALLEQFEAASNPRSPAKSHKKSKCPSIKTSSTMVHKSIKEALPKQVIDRIRESCKRRKEGNTVPKETAPEASSSADKKSRVSSSDARSSSSPSHIERVGDRKLLRLEHNYCCQDGLTEDVKAEEREVNLTSEESRFPGTPPDCSISRKDSGLESGELTDCSPIGSPHQPCLSLPLTPMPVLKQELDGESLEEINSKKKKKLKLEEYWERRKNMKTKAVAEGGPPSPHVDAPLPMPTTCQEVVIKTEPELPSLPPDNGLPTSTAADDSNCAASIHPPKTEAELNSPKPTMISVEVQTADVEPKEAKEDKKIDEELQKKKEMWLETMRRTYRARHSSSSSCSSYETKSWSRRRGKTASRRYRRRRSQNSYSRSRSKSTSSSSSSSSEYSTGRSRSKSRRRRRSFSRNRSRIYPAGRSRRGREERSPVDKHRQVEERRIVYVGQIEDGISKERLRDRFHKFGHIVAISLHFRERGDNYGFVTFKYPDNAYQAVEHGNDYGLEPKYDICFGGRRAFCKQRYSDLDSVGNNTMQQHESFLGPSLRHGRNSFDLLLREAQENLRKRSSV